MKAELVKHFQEKSALDMRTQVYLINKLAKEEEYKGANQTVLAELWSTVGVRFSEYRTLLMLSKEQIGILVWSFGHLNLDIIK
jgi:hypothetical protein